MYAVQSNSPAFTQNLPDGTLLGIGYAKYSQQPYSLVTGDLQGNLTTVYQFPQGENVLYTAVYATDGNYYGVSVPTSAAPYVN